MELPIFHMATMPVRIAALSDSIPRLLPQCKHLFVYLNNFRGYLPDILKHKKITVFFSEDEIGNTGDVGKFYNCDEWEPGFHCTVDDKLLYPHDYAQYMMKKVEQYNRKAVVSLHGRNFHDRPSESYYYDVKDFFGCMVKVDEQFVHEIGTGVMCFHTDTIRPSWDWFPYMNMTDIYMSLELQKREIPMLIAEHPRGYIGISPKTMIGHGISQNLNKKDSFQTEVINSVKWRINSV
jgi:hypothetical protein